MGAAFFCFLPSRVALARHLPNRALYSPVLVGIELLEGRRKEDCGYLRDKNKLDFHWKNNLCPQQRQNTTGTYLAEENPLMCLPVVPLWGLSRSDEVCLLFYLFFLNRISLLNFSLTVNREEHPGELRLGTMWGRWQKYGRIIGCSLFAAHFLGTSHIFISVIFKPILWARVTADEVLIFWYYEARRPQSSLPFIYVSWAQKGPVTNPGWDGQKQSSW